MRTKNILLLILLMSISVYFLSSKKEIKKSSTLGKVDKVLVIKSKREMHLIRKGKIIKTYKISLGDDPVGHKVKEGDERTPEGNYVLDWRNSKSSCYRSIHISYPNEEDKKVAEKLHVSPGGNVMIHGLHPSISWMGSKHTIKDWTDGCIAVTNEEMDEIWNSVSYGTPIEIRK